ncbi:MAG: hypothetical protein PHY81_05480 [Candidatus Bipolaricaulis anaerobius]|jgi:hypothetical protein|nr:hypothetical protein [Candidatus Bipolaricaulis sp.]MDD3747884.1 hypothetical protein [Candidatus Bipolaricaulis anaerobius]MDD5764523.1 hypothetical protein [Candidatus Bipolaricaulis anaerobius]
MSRKSSSREEIIRKLREAAVVLSRGGKVGDVAKEVGAHEVTYCRWSGSAG